jgi:hypothetical protein
MWRAWGTRRRWEDGITMDFKKIGWGVEWIQLAQDRDCWRALVNVLMNLRVLTPQGYLVYNGIKVSRYTP